MRRCFTCCSLTFRISELQSILCMTLQVAFASPVYDLLRGPHIQASQSSIQQQSASPCRKRSIPILNEQAAISLGCVLGSIAPGECSVLLLHVSSASSAWSRR